MKIDKLLKIGNLLKKTFRIPGSCICWIVLVRNAMENKLWMFVSLQNDPCIMVESRCKYMKPAFLITHADAIRNHAFNFLYVRFS